MKTKPYLLPLNMRTCSTQYHHGNQYHCIHAKVYLQAIKVSNILSRSSVRDKLLCIATSGQPTNEHVAMYSLILSAQLHEVTSNEHNGGFHEQAI